MTVQTEQGRYERLFETFNIAHTMVIAIITKIRAHEHYIRLEYPNLFSNDNKLR